MMMNQLNYKLCHIIKMGQENDTCANICQNALDHKPRDKLHAPN